jgi:hypothetical protein
LIKFKKFVAQAVKAKRRSDATSTQRFLDLAIARMEALNRLPEEKVSQVTEAK